MGCRETVVNDLTTLSDALDERWGDLPAAVRVLADDLTATVPSFLGLTVMLHVSDSPIVISHGQVDHSADAGGSLKLSLLPMGAATTTGSIAFYCGTPGAFLALADDVRWIFNLDGRPVLDGHLPTVPEPAALHGARGPPRVSMAPYGSGHRPGRRSRRCGRGRGRSTSPRSAPDDS